MYKLINIKSFKSQHVQGHGETLKILFATCQYSFQVYGGVETQILGLRDELQKRGVSVKLFDMFNDSVEDYNIVHIWRPLGNPLDACILANMAKKAGAKVVVSPIYWNPWRPVITVERHMVHFHPGSLIKNLVSSFVQKSGIDLGFASIYKFHADVLRNADLLLPNSWSEAHLLINSFKVNPERVIPVPIGVEEKFADVKPDKFVSKYGIQDFMLFVGRIEPRKNVLHLIKAFTKAKLDTQLVIIGHSHDEKYYKNCLEAAKGNKNIIFCGFLPHDSELLEAAYAAAKALVLPSWYETPGIVALEAGLAGANVAITKIGGTTEYFKNFAFYIDPSEISSIEKALVKSRLKEKSSELKEHTLRNYTMKNAARCTLEAYKRVLS